MEREERRDTERGRWGENQRARKSETGWVSIWGANEQRKGRKLNISATLREVPSLGRAARPS